MESVREGYATPPVIDICEGPNTERPNSSSGSLSDRTSLEECDEESQAIPSSLIKYRWQLVLGEKASLDDINHSIDQCKALVLETDVGSDERKWIVRHLVELRLRAEELKEAMEDPTLKENLTKVVLGHHFKLRQQVVTSPKRQYCDHCSGTIWSVVQASYLCSDCGYCCHHKCVSHVMRICANVVATEHGKPINDICPESGMAAQMYRCHECRSLLIRNISRNIIPAACQGYATCLLGQYVTLTEGHSNEARLCDYSGYYYCSTCHWNSESVIPARVVHNWDFMPRLVCRSSYQILKLFRDRPVIDLLRLNPKLSRIVPELSIVKKNQEDLISMLKYIRACRVAMEKNLASRLDGSRRHLVEESTTNISRDIDGEDNESEKTCSLLYSMNDLEEIRDGTLNEFLVQLREEFRDHIVNCEICRGKGYLCELCGNNEIIYPFDDCAYPCTKCNSIFHRLCWTKKSICPKCIRLEQKSKIQEDDDVERCEDILIS